MSALRWIYILTALLALLDTKTTKVHGGKIKKKLILLAYYQIC